MFALVSSVTVNDKPVTVNNYVGFKSFAQAKRTMSEIQNSVMGALNANETHVEKSEDGKSVSIGVFAEEDKHVKHLLIITELEKGSKVYEQAKQHGAYVIMTRQDVTVAMSLKEAKAIVRAFSNG